MRLNAAAWRAIVWGALALGAKMGLSAHSLLDSPEVVIVTWLVTAAFVVVGVSLIVIDEAPGMGWLCIAVAGATTIGELNSARWSFGAWSAIGYVLELTFLAAAVLLCLSYPGRPSWRTGSLVVGLLAFSVVMRLPLLFMSGRLEDGFYAPQDWSRPEVVEWHDLIVRVGRGGTALVLVGVAVLLVGRAWRVRGLARQSIMGLAVIGAITALGSAIDQAVWLDASLRSSITLGGDLRNVAGAMVPIALLTDLWRRHFAIASATDRVLHAARSGDPRAIQRALSEVLADPTVTVSVSTPTGRWVDVDGAAAESTPAHRRTYVVTEQDQPVLRFSYDGRAVADDRILEPIEKVLRIGLENLKLHADLMARMVELEESRARIAGAALEERRRVERDLHDGAQQSLLAVVTKLSLVDVVPDDEVRNVIVDARRQLIEGLAALRDLARGLYPASLVKGGLRAALPDLVSHAQVRVDLDLPDDLPRFAPRIEATAYFVVAEALTNITRHAPDATARVFVRAAGSDLRLMVSDDGWGGVDESAGSGLTGLRDRVVAVGGSIHVHDDPCSQHPDSHGVLIEARLPAEAAELDESAEPDEPAVAVPADAAVHETGVSEGGFGRSIDAGPADRSRRGLDPVPGGSRRATHVGGSAGGRSTG